MQRGQVCSKTVGELGRPISGWSALTLWIRSASVGKSGAPGENTRAREGDKGAFCGWPGERWKTEEAVHCDSCCVSNLLTALIKLFLEAFFCPFFSFQPLYKNVQITIVTKALPLYIRYVFGDEAFVEWENDPVVISQVTGSCKLWIWQIMWRHCDFH